MSTAWDALNDNVAWTQTSIPVENFLYAHNLNLVTEVALSTVTLGASTPTAGKAWFYMDTGRARCVRADVIWGGAVRGTTTVPAASGYAWRSVNVSRRTKPRSMTCGFASPSPRRARTAPTSSPLTSS